MIKTPKSPYIRYPDVWRIWQRQVTPQIGMIYASDGTLWVYHENGDGDNYTIFWPFGYWGEQQ